MTTQELINEAAKYIQKYAPKYGIKVYSPILGQMLLESAKGTSELAVNANNYFGLKYKQGRCPTAVGIYYKKGSEQNTDGSYVVSNMQWCKFKNLEDCIIGYFDFINISRYSNLKGVTVPKEYLEKIKEDGYATSLKYVDNVYRVIQTYNLTQYDNNKGDDKNMGYTNSPLVTYTKISPNKTSPRNHVIDTITIHCMAGNLTVETCGNVFAKTSRKASSNYGVGTDGRIAMYVEEKDRSWCSSNSTNDHRAVTIEVANDGGAETGWHVSDKAMESLIKLVADICKRNNIKELKWSTNKSARVNHKNGCNMTVHRDFAAKACPGDYLYNKHGYIADEVNKLLGVKSTTTSSVPQPTTPSTAKTYTVQKGDTLSKIGSKTGIAWKTIAELNGIKSPYVVKVGQVLKLTTESSNSSSSSTSSKKYVSNGIDYSLVFDPTYYANKYDDLKKAFGINADKLFAHFISHGMQEARQAISTFNVTVYKNRYADLRKAFGNDLPAYYRHYIQFGKKEERSAV